MDRDMKEAKEGVSNLLENDKDILIYYRSLSKITGNRNSSMVLSQLIQCWEESDTDEFCRYINIPNGDTLAGTTYSSGESLSEELGLKTKALSSALKRIATKVKNESGCELLFVKNEITSLVAYWQDQHHVTWWKINWNLLEELLTSLENKE